MLEFEITNLGFISYFFEIKYVFNSDGVFMHQKRYAIEILKESIK